MANTAAAVPEEQHFLLSNLSPSLAQRRLALAVVLALLAAFATTAGPLSSIQPGRIGAFVPAYATAILMVRPCVVYGQRGTTSIGYGRH
jgi:hypothetical protein